MCSSTIVASAIVVGLLYACRGRPAPPAGCGKRADRVARVQLPGAVEGVLAMTRRHRQEVVDGQLRDRRVDVSGACRGGRSTTRSSSRNRPSARANPTAVDVNDLLSE